jgi:hypothetical protein
LSISEEITMADEKKTQQINLEDESKKDTVRINLPPGLTGKTAAPAPGGPATVKLKPAASGEDEAKKETAVMGKPAETPKPKSDTSRVQVSSAKPGVPETPRPTVKLKQPEAAPAARPATTAAAPAAAAAAAEPSGALAGLSLAAMVLAVVVAAYLGMLAFG